MKKSLNRLWPPLLTLAFGLAVFLFWRIRYPAALAYQEQFQLFLLTGEYMRQTLSLPAGLSRWLAEFVVQFYNNVTFGAVLLALLLMLLQRLTWRISREKASYALSFLPAIVMLFALGDENVMLTYVVALIIVLLGIWLLPKGQGWKTWVYLLIATPLLYWMAGPLAIFLPIYLLIREVVDSKNKSKGILMGIVGLIYMIAIVILSSHIVNYPLDWLSMGIGYYRFPLVISYASVAAAVLAIVVAFVRLPQRKWTELVATIAVAVVAFLLIPQGFDAKKYDLIEYDYLVRTHKWDAIIAKSERKQPDLPMSVCATNLALGMTNQLGDRAFHFYQRGSQGLLPPFERNFASTLLTGEAYWQLGLVNTAQRFAFEAMEALPNYNKSCRVVKRLAETNLINGQYEVARKYLEMLQHTTFYSRWADRIMELLGNEKAINEHPLYGRMRQLQLKDDFLFSEREMDKMIGQLFIHNPSNDMAKQYLLLYPLLDRDINTFMQYFGAVQSKVSYFPTIAQEAVVFGYYKQRQQPPQGLVSDLMLQNMNRFSQAYAAGPKSPQLEAFRGTLWYYLSGAGESK
ncbi:MAG: DUF6057 family protein [Prevotella sp.]|nr:DUF6057 family protein [Prevotella sp.]